MTRSLTSATQTQRALTSTSPANILKIAFGGETGTRYYADRDLGSGDGLSPLNAQGRVLVWGRISLVLAEQKAPALGDCTIEMADPDGTLEDIFKAVELQRKKVTLYQYFENLGESDLVPIMAGIINAPVRWIEKSGSLRFDITDISTFYRATVGCVADRDTFPTVAERDENKVLPLVFGRVTRSPAVQAKAGAAATLVRACTATDTRLYVDDASHFPQNQTIQIRIEKELIQGQFQGNTFHVDARGIELVSSSTVTAAAGMFHLEDDTLPGEENEYAGYFIRVTDPGDTVHHRRIHYYSAELHRICYIPEVLYNEAQWEIPAGTTYAITSWARSHEAGLPVYFVQENYVYILNDAPSKAVRSLVAYGQVLEETALTGGKREVLDIKGWIPVDPNDYTLNLNDTTSFPDLGRPVTTATFRLNPKELYPQLKSDDLWADIEGVESEGDGTGTLLENPADIIKALLSRWMGVEDAELDTASFTLAASELAGLRMAFTLARQWDALHLCADLAFQARCALLWDDGKARLVVLKNCVGTPSAELGAGQVVADSLQRGRTDIRHLASEVIGRFRSGGETPTVVVRDSAVEALYGRRVKTINLWSYDDRRMAVTIARFWLERWKYLYEEVRLTTFLTSLELQPNDVVTLNLTDHFPAAQRATIREIIHQPGMGEAGIMDAITLGLRLPVAAGCDSTCETECESWGESGCLLYCEVQAELGCWQCETQCEALCELACTTEAEIHCIVSDTGGGGGGGCGGCETSCEAGCETGCEAACETSCEAACETTCQGGCESSCEAGCEVACEAACETSCEAGCEVGCETGCEIACETSCETACETGCEASCETSCETGCETSCEDSCEIACESGCETSCESACETSCQTGAECADAIHDTFNRDDADPLSDADTFAWTSKSKTGGSPPNNWALESYCSVLYGDGSTTTFTCCWCGREMCSDDHDVNTTVHQAGSTADAIGFVLARGNSAGSQFYRGGARSEYQIKKYIGGVGTLLGEIGGASGTTILKLEVIGSALKLYSPALTLKVSVTNSDIPSGTYVGFGASGMLIDNTKKEIQDNWSAATI